MDYVKFFGLQREPFQNDLDGHFYFEGAAQRRARLYLLRALEQHKGLALVLGGPGLGKTTLAHHLLCDLDRGKFAAHILLSSHRECARGWFLPQVARAYGVSAPAGRVPELIEQIHEHLLAVREEGRHPVLFVDEAQLLGESQALEEFRALLNLAHEGQRIFSLLLFGMDELGGVMALDPSLAQRVDVRVQLRALDAAETGTYLAHRLHQAGGELRLLADDAVVALYLYSQGVPRVLNTLADNALFEAALEESPSMTGEHVAAAALQLGLVRSAPAESGGRAVASFHLVSTDAARARLAPPAPAPEPPAAEPALVAEEEPLFGENTAESLGSPATEEEDWLEPVAPVFDEVLRSFDETETRADARRTLAEDEPVGPGRDEAEPVDAGSEESQEWSLGDLDLGSSLGDAGSDVQGDREDAGVELGPLQDDDSIAGLTFADEEEGLEAALDLDAPEPAPFPHSERPTGSAAAEAGRPRGPRIDLPEDDDLDSLFDEIQIDA